MGTGLSICKMPEICVKWLKYMENDLDMCKNDLNRLEMADLNMWEKI